MYKGEPTEGIKFYNLLIESKEFTSELGKVTLASGKLEAELTLFLIRKGIEGDYGRVTLGPLINKVKKNNLLDKNMVIALEQISIQRNYIMHNIYALFTGLKDETILEKNNLLDSDVLLYFERVWELKKNIDDLTDIINKKE